MFDLPLLGWVCAIVSAALVGLSKTGLPGAGTLAIPLMAMAVPPRASTGALLPLLIVGDILAVAWYRRHASWPHLRRVIPWAAAGVVVGWALLSRMTDAIVQPLIGGVVLTMLALYHWSRRRSAEADRLPESRGFSAGVGVTAGTVTMLANAAGPVMTLYLVAMRLPKTLFIGTAAWYFFLLNLFKVPFSAGLGLIRPDSLRFNLVLAPFVVAGGVVGILVAKRIPERLFTVVVQVLAAAAALKLLFPWLKSLFVGG